MSPIYLLRLLFSFRGRANRAAYWLVSVTWAALALIVGVISNPYNYIADRFGQDHRIDAAIVVAVLLVAVSCLAMCVRRLHDRDKSAAWLLLYLVTPVILEGAAGVNTLDAGPSVLLMLLSGAISLWAFIDLGCLAGTFGANRYGADPLAADSMMSAG